MSSFEHQNKRSETEKSPREALSEAMNSLAENEGREAAAAAALGEFLRAGGGDGLEPSILAYLMDRAKPSNPAPKANYEPRITPPSTEARVGAKAAGDVFNQPHRAETERQERERIVREAIKSTMEVSFSGKFPNGLHVERINDRIAPLHYPTNGWADYATYSHYTAKEGQIPNKNELPYSQIDSIRTMAHKQGSRYQNEINADFLLFRTAKNLQTQEARVQITFNRNPENMIDNINRPVFNIAVTALLPEKEGRELQKLCSQGDRKAIDDFISKIAPGQQEFTGPKHDVIVAEFDSKLSMNDTAIGEFLRKAVIVKPDAA